MVVTGEVTLEAAHRLDAALALGFLAGEVRAGLWIDAAACDRDDVQGAVDPQSVDQPCALADERVAVIAQQPDLRSFSV